MKSTTSDATRIREVVGLNNMQFSSLVILILAIATFASGKAQAQRLTVLGDSLFLNQRSNVQVQLIGSNADFNNVFGIQSPINQDLFRCQREVPIGFTLDSGNRGPGELVFRLTTPEGFTYFTGSGGRNPDGQVHVRYQVISSDRVRIAWEDLFNLQDADFNDCIVDIVASAEVPAPPVQALADPNIAPLSIIPRIFVSEKDTPGLTNADRNLVLSIAVYNTGSAPRTLVLCPMLHVHDPGEVSQVGQVIAVTATGEQGVDFSVNEDFDDDGQLDGPGIYRHGRSFRFPFPLPIPLTVSANSNALVNYSAKLSEFIPTLADLTRAEIESKIRNHESTVSSLYIDYFFNFQNTLPGFNFQCPHGANTWWNGTIDLPNYQGLGECGPGDFCANYDWYNFTITNVFSTLTVPVTIHTSQTEAALIAGTPISAFIEVIPHCFLVECPSTPGIGGTSGLPTVVWTTDPAPGEIFVIDELEKVGEMTLDFPSPVPEGAVVAFTVNMKEADSGRLLSTEAKRFALDTKPPEIISFDFIKDRMGNLLASATILDEAASIKFVELLVSRNGGRSFAGFPMDWKDGDFLNPTLFETTFSPLRPGLTIFKIRAVDEASNSSETRPHAVVEVPVIK